MHSLVALRLRIRIYNYLFQPWYWSKFNTRVPSNKSTFIFPLLFPGFFFFFPLLYSLSFFPSKLSYFRCPLFGGLGEHKVFAFIPLIQDFIFGLLTAMPCCWLKRRMKKVNLMLFRLLLGYDLLYYIVFFWWSYGTFPFQRSLHFAFF